MSTKFCVFNDLDNHEQAEYAGLISAYTNHRLAEMPQMLPVSTDAIYRKHLGVVALLDGVFVGYVGATPPERHNADTMTEVGTLWVPETHRNRGLALGLVTTITGRLAVEALKPYAFCNDRSIRVFSRAGYSEACKSEVPQSAFGLCRESCRNWLLQEGCCDTLTIFKGEAT